MTDLSALSSAVESALARLAAASSTTDVDAIETDALGHDSAIAALKRGMKDVPADQKADVGRRLNEATTTLQAAIAEARRGVEAREEEEKLRSESVDITLPGRQPARGKLHLINSVIDEIVDIFVGLGYSVADGPEAETSFYNFDALNTPPAHPSRLESDTFYLNHGDDPEGVLLRTHTSPIQARWMEAHPPPVYIVAPGRVYRNEAADATHSAMFHQLEGLVVDEGITFGDLKGTLQHFADEFFGAGRRLRFLPNHFPFTEPSAEMHVSCFACDGDGCKVCSRTGWLELLGCGMVHPRVLEIAGYDSTVVSGFAFGMGVDRLAQVRHGIPALRYSFDPDIRVLEQFA